MKLFYGIDLGGTSVKLGRFTEDGELREKWEIPTRIEENGKYIFDDIAASILEKTRACGCQAEDIAAAGLGIPGTLWKDGFLEICVNIGLQDVYPAKEISRRLNNIPVQVGNDANVAALGEFWKGGGAGYDSLCLLTLGTGVGGGIILDGKVLSGAHGIAGELGHMQVRPEESEACNCGNYGCLEQVASATGIVREAKRMLAASDKPSSLRQKEYISAKTVLDAAKAGDELAGEVMARVADCLSIVMAQVTHVVNPAVFVFGGGVSRAGQYLVDIIRPAYEKRIFLTKNQADIQLATLGNDAGIFGAARMALDLCRKEP